MARPRSENPTPAELEILQAIWDRGPSTVRQVLTVLRRHRPLAYTTVMSLMNVMVAKDLLIRRLQGRAFVYQAKSTRQRTRSRILQDVLRRAFGGSTAALVNHLLRHGVTSDEELDEIARTISEVAGRKETKDERH